MTENKNYQRKLRKLSEKIEKAKQAEKVLKEEFKRRNEIEKSVNSQTDKIKNFIIKNIENNLTAENKKRWADILDRVYEEISQENLNSEISENSLKFEDLQLEFNSETDSENTELTQIKTTYS
jgi:type II secretory pathway component PulJ